MFQPCATTCQLRFYTNLTFVLGAAAIPLRPSHTIVTPKHMFDILNLLRFLLCLFGFRLQRVSGIVHILRIRIF